MRLYLFKNMRFLCEYVNAHSKMRRRRLIAPSICVSALVCARLPVKVPTSLMRTSGAFMTL